VTTAFFFCQGFQHQVQTAGSAAPSPVAPGLAFMFAAAEPDMASASAMVAASLGSSTVLNATCQQTFSELFRGIAPALGTNISIMCPKRTNANLS
jgi:hypothetical protein